MARTPEALRQAVKPLLAAAAILLPGCASADTPRPTNGPVVQEVIATATAVPCDSEEFARKNGLPTPVSVGDSAASPEIVRITSKLYRCEALSEIEQAAIRKLNEEHPLLATPDPAKQVIPLPTNTPESALKLADNDVYEGLENKTSVIYMAVPDNTVVFQVRRGDIFCSDDRTRPLAWLVKFPRTASGFDHQRRVQNSLTQIAIGNMTSPDTIVVKVGNEQYTTPSPDGRGGQITCSANSFEVTTRKIGVGEGVLKKGLARILELPALPPQVEAVIDRQIGKR